MSARKIFTARYTLDALSAKLLMKDVERQSSVALGESTTDGFTLLNADASWSFGFNVSARLTLTAITRNLTDERARNYAPFVKYQVLLTGRNIGVGCGWIFERALSERHHGAPADAIFIPQRVS